MRSNSVVLAAAAAILSLATAPPILNSNAQPRVLNPQGEAKGRQSFTGTIVTSGEHYIVR